MNPQKGDLNNGNGDGAAPETPKAKPSDKQLNLLATIMQNLEEQPKVNWQDAAAQAGLKNERVAKEMYRQMCKKFNWNSKGGGGSGGGSDKKPKPNKVVKTPKKTATRKTTVVIPAGADKDDTEDVDSHSEPFESLSIRD